MGQLVPATGMPSSALSCWDSHLEPSLEQSHVPPTLLNSYFHLHPSQISVFTIKLSSIYFLK